MCKSANQEFSGKKCKILVCQHDPQNDVFQRHEGQKKELFWSLSPKDKSRNAPVDKAQRRERLSRFCGLPRPDPASLS